VHVFTEMVASLLKIISSGIQDTRLAYRQTLYPFVKLWRRAGRFTTQWVRFDFDRPPVFGGTSQFRITRKGHLLTRLYVVSRMPDIYTVQNEAKSIAQSSGNDFAGPVFGWTNSLGHALIEQANIAIANDVLDRLDSRLLEILDEYTVPIEKVTATNRLIARMENGFDQGVFGTVGSSPQEVAVSLPFWFARGDPACALPVDAIQNDEIVVSVKFRDIAGLYYTASRSAQGVAFDASSTTMTTTAQGASLWPIENSVFYMKDSGGVVVSGLRDASGQTVSSAVSVIPGIQMPALNSTAMQLGETYIMAEFVYLDQPEANRFRLADLQVPIVQHYIVNSTDTQGLPYLRIPIGSTQPVRDVYWMAQRVEAPTWNAHFLATRDVKDIRANSYAPWWPDASGLNTNMPGFLKPGFSTRDSEPIVGCAFAYDGDMVRFRTDTPPLYRAVLPSYEAKKSPWINRYMYNFSFGFQNGWVAFSSPQGEANFGKVKSRDLVLQISPQRGAYNSMTVDRFMIYAYVENYNILRVYGGRAGVLF
jgi:hypothetical protein